MTNDRKGFTLIEMLVVMGIIAILSGALLMGYGKLTRTAQRARAQETVSNVATALNIILQKNGTWPSGLAAYHGSDSNGKGCVVEVAKIFSAQKLLGVSMSNGKPAGSDRCGIVDPWAVAVLKRDTFAKDSTAVPSGGTVKAHIIYYALDTDYDGITEAKVCGETVRVRANAIAWCAGGDGILGNSYSGHDKYNSDNVYSWNKKQEVHE